MRMSELSEEMVAELLSLEKRNLIQNPHGAEQLEGWEITENGGCQWRVEELPGDCGKEFPDETVQSYFATSFELCLKKQLVDLRAEGCSEELLDTVQPKIMVQDWALRLRLHLPAMCVSAQREPGDSPGIQTRPCDLGAGELRLQLEPDDAHLRGLWPWSSLC
ncbi:F-box only protein 2-like isoform X2 [Polyodon spathula]|uniref:F-box only protein 2-like isoform X2 n=1 Tax=Polyodon spathula TaxID=7913 RepID=UPI001B7EDC1E|nr:F-box only protein 2-like isoform X2 [Polyodon spathula]